MAKFRSSLTSAQVRFYNTAVGALKLHYLKLDVKWKTWDGKR